MECQNLNKDQCINTYIYRNKRITTFNPDTRRLIQGVLPENKESRKGFLTECTLNQPGILNIPPPSQIGDLN